MMIVVMKRGAKTSEIGAVVKSIEDIGLKPFVFEYYYNQGNEGKSSNPPACEHIPAKHCTEPMDIN